MCDAARCMVPGDHPVTIALASPPGGYGRHFDVDICLGHKMAFEELCRQLGPRVSIGRRRPPVAFTFGPGHLRVMNPGDTLTFTTTSGSLFSEF